MPSAITHGFVAIAFGKVFPRTKSFKFWLLSIVCSIVPDADVIAFKFGIPYENMFGHRGFTHSVVFAILLALVVVLIGFPEILRTSKQCWIFIFYFFILTASHGILDAMTDGGLGVGFFIPFDSSRYFFPFRPIKVSPISISRFFDRDSGFAVLMSEVLWVWLPATAL